MVFCWAAKGYLPGAFVSDEVDGRPPGPPAAPVAVPTGSCVALLAAGELGSLCADFSRWFDSMRWRQLTYDMISGA